ncbi:MAG: ABC transporter ATP-binding protein [Clostridia bacterium]|nr:ABC transporter ATP-binding protein [Clostridia bacterium]
MKMIDVKELSFKYQKKGKLVLDKLNFSCEKGTVNVLIGLNGSGKTTLIKTIAGLLENYQGEVFIDGKNLKGLSIKERAKKMAYVSQHSNAVDDFPVLDYLLFGTVNKMNFYQSPKEEDKKRVLDCAEEFGITHLLDKKLGEISGGERQIVSICGAIVQDTDLVVLDEPTSALDIKNQHAVLAIIKKIAREQGKTFILSSHNPNHALYLSSNVFLLRHGKILAQGQAEDIINIEALKTVYGEDICYSVELPYKEISFKD